MRSAVGCTTAAIIAIGVELASVKTRLEHGTFTLWVEAECGFTMRTAENYIRVATFAADKNEMVSVLPPATLYKIAAESAPSDVVGEVLTSLNTGNPLSAVVIDDMLYNVRFKQRREALERRRYSRPGRNPPSEEAEKRREREAQRAEDQRNQSTYAAVYQLPLGELLDILAAAQFSGGSA